LDDAVRWHVDGACGLLQLASVINEQLYDDVVYVRSVMIGIWTPAGDRTTVVKSSAACHKQQAATCPGAARLQGWLWTAGGCRQRSMVGRHAGRLAGRPRAGSTASTASSRAACVSVLDAGDAWRTLHVSATDVVVVLVVRWRHCLAAFICCRRCSQLREVYTT